MHHPPGMTGFEFAVMSDCGPRSYCADAPRAWESSHKLIVTAQMEVAAGLIGRAPDAIIPGADKVRRV